MEAFDDLPTDVPAEYLTGFAGFVLSGGEKAENMDKQDYVYVLNQVAGVDRVEGNGEGRATQEIVSTDEAGDDALGAHEYTNNIFQQELEAWARHALQSEDSD
jgi:hypothetical protein